MNTTGKTNHEVTVERLLKQAVTQLEKLNSAILKNFGSLSPSMAIEDHPTIPSSMTKPNKRIASRSATAAPLKPTASIRPNTASKPQSYTIPASRAKAPKQALTAPFPPLSPSVAKALKGPQFDFVPWFINEFCQENRGRTITCRAVSEVSALQFRRHPATEIALAVVAKHFPDTFKIVKTSAYEDATFAGNEIIIQPADNPTNKRLSAVRIF